MALITWLIIGAIGLPLIGALTINKLKVHWLQEAK